MKSLKNLLQKNYPEKAGCKKQAWMKKQSFLFLKK